MLALSEAVPLLEDTGFARIQEAVAPYLRRMLVECSGKDPVVAMQSLHEIEEQANNFLRENFGTVSRTFRAYEYAIADVVGVKVPHGMKGYSYPLEDEVVVGSVPPGNVIACREVTIKDHWSGYYLVKRSPYLEGHEASFGTWRSMDGGELTNETFSRLSILQERIATRERAGFTWQDYRQGPTPERLTRLIDAMMRGDAET